MLFRLNSTQAGNETTKSQGSFVFDISNSKAENFRSPLEAETKGITALHLKINIIIFKIKMFFNIVTLFSNKLNNRYILGAKKQNCVLVKISIDN